MPSSNHTAPPSRQNTAWWLLLAVTVAGLGWVLLRPGEGHDGLNLVPLQEIARVLRPLRGADEPLQHPAFRYLVRNVGGNVAAFLPLGLAVAGLLRSRGGWIALRGAVVVGFLFSLSIELLQLIVPLRVTDIDDLLFNTAGAFLGGVLALLIPRRSP
jgi:glycopeptide antibiotics resistance protein